MRLSKVGHCSLSHHRNPTKASGEARGAHGRRGEGEYYPEGQMECEIFQLNNQTVNQTGNREEGPEDLPEDPPEDAPEGPPDWPEYGPDWAEDS
jgi:hypothetical protein